ncbi:hypothetical protein LCGC14_2191910 [marine sediment metagenome]|uniref:Uncharacterized protein n=1 Tax=marine sediment metagenome TaxID=412755 RepID=A0A0F9E6F0_9ZZZZ
MAGNTRGKLKEHFEGIHRNMDWALHHIAKSATLIEARLSQLPGFQDAKGDAEKELAFLNTHPMYQAVTTLGEGLKTFDGLAQDIYTQI